MRLCLSLAAAVLAGCSGTLPKPSYTPQPASALVEVALPPPPGRVEDIPKSPNRGAVWVDGEWQWHRHKWAWQPGYWATPPAGAKLAPWVFVRGTDGRLWMASGTWRDAKGAAVQGPAGLAAAHVDAAEVVNASGASEATGSTVRATPSPYPE